ncbi:hypothetical protein [Oceanisphaera pacifica]|uniref:Uncharacterized protein n=1 Tax=Oceanisphaera pacifica TaxID=2818389 RepID=A0ABS3NEX6_9GAMM|nr:hypothetical protein [Oceanisphaera pacifica]MBO1519080.1 hypothetical protein [Oceanisphaera pacifica]
MSEHESLRKAIAWIVEHTTIDEHLVNEASRRFDLSPLDDAFLQQYFVELQQPKSQTSPDNTDRKPENDQSD